MSSSDGGTRRLAFPTVRGAALGIAVIIHAAASAPARAEDGASGTIEICRGPEVRYPGESQRIEIPRGAVFGDSGRLVSTGYGGASGRSGSPPPRPS